MLAFLSFHLTYLKALGIVDEDGDGGVHLSLREVLAHSEVIPDDPDHISLKPGEHIEDFYLILIFLLLMQLSYFVLCLAFGKKSWGPLAATMSQSRFLTKRRSGVRADIWKFLAPFKLFLYTMTQRTCNLSAAVSSVDALKARFLNSGHSNSACHEEDTAAAEVRSAHAPHRGKLHSLHRTDPSTLL